VIGAKPGVAYGQCEKRDQAVAISIGHHAAVRALVRRLRVESAQSRNYARARLFVDHSTIHRWVIKLVPVLEQAFRKRKRKRCISAVGKSWRLDETYIKIGGQDRYWYRAVDKQGNTVDFLLTAKRDGRAARRFFTRAVKNARFPKIVNIDKSGANKAGIGDYNATHGTKVVIRQCKCLNNVVEQDHRAVKRITRPIQGSRTFVVRESF
jgi:putative transposase